MIIRPGTAGDFATVTAWLDAAGLPTADLDETHMRNFLVAVSGDAPVGMVGLEEFADVGLLRSLAVDPEARNAGIGRQLVAALEAHAVAKGIRELWLLTIDADGYFTKLGYEAQERDQAPDSIRGTREFSELCPGNAVMMKKAIG